MSSILTPADTFQTPPPDPECRSEPILAAANQGQQRVRKRDNKMQSGYGVSEIQQFMVESCAPPLFSIASANTAAPAPADIHPAGHNPLKYHPLAHPHHPQLHPPALPPHFAHFHSSIPITQQLFQQPPSHHHFQLFHPQHHQQQQYQIEPRRLIPHHQLALDQESGPENSASVAAACGGGGGSSFLSAAMGFKLSVNESSGGCSRDGINDDDSILQGDDGSESRLHHWQREDETAIKELSWRPLDLDIDYITRNNKRCKDKEPETSNAKSISKKSKEAAESEHAPASGGGNYKIYSELEAIYKPGGIGGGGNQAGSGSALTGEETPLLHAAAVAPPVGMASETSAGEEATAEAAAKKLSKGRRRRKRRQRQLSSVAAFFESLVKRLMEHQEGLHRKFLEAMERREQERASREEAWQKKETAKSKNEAEARARERALAASREAAIVAFLEKLTGESVNLPSKPQFPSNEEENNHHNNSDNPNPQIEGFIINGESENSKAAFSTSRWPKAEVQALIRVRSGLESRFQEPGLKGPLWEEVSAAMAGIGYQRSSKRCKEKWENINKYFRKTKESGKKRPQHSKTCPYFQLLDQLYSNKPNPCSPNVVNVADDNASCKNNRKDNSELLDAIIVPTDRENFKFNDSRFDFNSKMNDNDREIANDNEEEEDDIDDDQGRAEELRAEEEEGESHGQENLSTKQHQEEDDDDDDDDTSLFFQRLQS